MIANRERDALISELAELERLLAQLPGGRLARVGFESRREEIEARLSEIDSRRGRVAEAVLLFRGRPVHGTRGVEAEFGGAALEKFQGVVSRVAAAKAGALGARGPIPDESSSRLLVTGTSTGSFGFVLEENAQAPLFGSTPLAEAVEDTARLIDAALDDERFGDAVEQTEPRVIQSLSWFLEVLKNNDATLHVRTGDSEIVIDDIERIRAAHERTATFHEEADEPVSGVLQGILPGTRRFEFRRASDGEVIAGRISKEIESPEDLKHEFVDKRCVAHLRVKTFHRPGKEYRRYELKRVTAEPSDQTGAG